MTGSTDWYRWHSPYADRESPLSQRLRLVQRHVSDWLDERPDPRLTVVSACAGQGRDLLEVLAGRPDAHRVRASLIEYDERNVAAARARLGELGLAGVTVRQGDAGELASYRDAVPADLVLLAGVLGNISDADVRATVQALPQLCAAGSTVVWTRSRRVPDLTGAIRDWLGAAGFTERAFHAPDGVLFSVGVHRFDGPPQPLAPAGTLFRFIV